MGLDIGIFTVIIAVMRMITILSQ